MTYQDACKLKSGDYCYIPEWYGTFKIVEVQDDAADCRVWLTVQIEPYATMTVRHDEVEPDGNQ